MRRIAIRVIPILVALWFCASVPASAESKDDPCRGEKTNIAMRECYLKEQTVVNAETDSLAREIAAKYRNQAHDPVLGRGASGQLRKAASTLMESQRTWKIYRDQHCKAVMYSWTTGSGTGTAYEACLFKFGKTRVQDLRSDFVRGGK